MVTNFYETGILRKETETNGTNGSSGDSPGSSSLFATWWKLAMADGKRGSTALATASSIMDVEVLRLLSCIVGVGPAVAEAEVSEALPAPILEVRISPALDKEEGERALGDMRLGWWSRSQDVEKPRNTWHYKMAGVTRQCFLSCDELLQHILSCICRASLP